MTIDERRKFISDLIRGVEESILQRADKMPDHWDGHELRRYIADWFEDQNGMLARGKVRQRGASKRLAQFRNDATTLNL